MAAELLVLASIFGCSCSDGVSPYYPILYIHVQKNGGSTVEASTELFPYGGAHSHGYLRQYEEGLDAFPAGKFVSNNRLETIMKLTKVPKSQYARKLITAAHVRHPCTRLLSVWDYFSLVKPRGDWPNIIAHYVGDWEKNFTSFVEQVYRYSTIPRESHKMMHAHQQLDQLVFANGSFGIDVLMFTEFWREGISDLGKNVHANFDKLATSQINKSPGDKRCNAHYSAHTWDLLLKIYRNDFCAFGFSENLNEATSLHPFASADFRASRPKEFWAKRVHMCSLASNQKQ